MAFGQHPWIIKGFLKFPQSEISAVDCHFADFRMQDNKNMDCVETTMLLLTWKYPIP